MASLGLNELSNFPANLVVIDDWDIAREITLLPLDECH